MAPRGTDFGAWTGALRGRLTRPCFRPQGLAGRGRRPWGRGGRRAGRAPGNKQVPRRRPSRLAGQHAGQHADHPAAKPEGPGPGSRAQGRGETGGMTSTALPGSRSALEAVTPAMPHRCEGPSPLRFDRLRQARQGGLGWTNGDRSAIRARAAGRGRPGPQRGEAPLDVSRAYLRHLLRDRVQAALVTDAAPSLPDPSLVDTIERRHGRRIGATGPHRDPVRSSRGPCFKAGGLAGLGRRVLVAISRAGRVWAPLPDRTRRLGARRPRAWPAAPDADGEPAGVAGTPLTAGASPHARRR
ncbi:hypothetical protein SAMN02927895_05475 [Belnapia rosea]|nr:hypothetical protein SAMN02927895_05475 [Belnapia rosea]